MRCDQLTPQNRGAEGYNGEDEDRYILPSFAGGSQFGGYGQGGEFIDPRTDPGKDHPTCDGGSARIKTLLGGAGARTDEYVHRVRG